MYFQLVNGQQIIQLSQGGSSAQPQIIQVGTHLKEFACVLKIMWFSS